MILEKSWRYEKKYLIDKSERIYVQELIRNNKFLFKEKFKKRKVRSIYFDDLNFSSYYENIEGLSDRTKYRLRWYGDTFKESSNAQFEFKIKCNKTNSKEIFKVNNIHFDIKDNCKTILEKTLNSINNNEFKYILKKLRPIVFVEYERIYFESFCRNIRLTYDNKLSFRRASNPRIKSSIFKYDVIEIKYASYNEEKFLKYIPYFQKRATRNSKYINAIHYLSIL